MRASRWAAVLFAVAVSGVSTGCGGGREEAPPAAPEAPKEAPPAYQVLERVPSPGKVIGRVLIEGPVPKLRPHGVKEDQAYCGKADRPNLALRVDQEGCVANAVVRLVGIAKGKPFPEGESKLDQKSCLYDPYIQIIPKGRKLTILNSDPINHNARGFGEDGKTIFNVATPNEGARVEQTISGTGPIKIKCDVHSWMFAWAYVVETPYVELTEKDGSFEIGDVPPGTYRIEVWHELLGGKGFEVKVTPGETARADLKVSVVP